MKTEKVIKNVKEELNLKGDTISILKKISYKKERLNFEKGALRKEIDTLKSENISKEDNLKAIKIEMKLFERKIIKSKINWS